MGKDPLPQGSLKQPAPQGSKKQPAPRGMPKFVPEPVPEQAKTEQPVVVGGMPKFVPEPVPKKPKIQQEETFLQDMAMLGFSQRHAAIHQEMIGISEKEREKAEKKAKKQESKMVYPPFNIFDLGVSQRFSAIHQELIGISGKAKATPQNIVLGGGFIPPTKPERRRVISEVPFAEITVKAPKPEATSQSKTIMGKTLTGKDLEKYVKISEEVIQEHRATREAAIHPKGIKDVSATSLFRGVRDIVVQSPFMQPGPAEKYLAPAMAKSGPLGKASASFISPSRSAKVPMDIPIGFVKAGEALVRPDIKTATGALMSTGLYAVTHGGALPSKSTYSTTLDKEIAKAREQFERDLKAEESRARELYPELSNIEIKAWKESELSRFESEMATQKKTFVSEYKTPIESYATDIKGREGELVGELTFEYLLGKAIGKGVSKAGGAVKKELIGSKVDKWLLEHSSRYANWAAKQIKPQVISSPVFDVGQKAYTWSPARQAGIDVAWALEQTPRTSGITAPALLETATKTRVLPHLISRGGQVSIGVLRDYGFSKSKEGLLSAPSQIGIQTTSESSRVLPHIPSITSRIVSSGAVPSMIGAGAVGASRAFTPQETVVQPKTETITEEELKQTPSVREIPYLPEIVGVTPKKREQQIVIPRLSLIPETVIQKAPTIPKLVPVQPQREKEIVIPKIGQIPRVVPEQQPKTHQIPRVIPSVVQQQRTQQKQKQVQITLRTPPPLTRTPPPFVFDIPKLPQLGSIKRSELFGGWRLKEHPIPSLEQFQEVALGIPQKKKKKTHPRKRKKRK